MSKKPRRSKTIKDIIDAAGGASAVATAVGGLTPDAVWKWPRAGIPDRYWSAIIPLANVTATQLFTANEAARAEKAA